MPGNSADDKDLGFIFEIRKNGDIDIRRHGHSVTLLRGKKALQVASQLKDSEFDQQQQIMARLTGNYKRGNEKQNRH
ncbi:MAG: hypothetical protein CMP91_02535 [Gammaproteobacteria bacterium]|nr:hypothetical protein [Gammaproteobacteria bacterium]|tara:strand:- start:288525 stop:288755 length:231 start_codon:yes stop_codon:yes gene_type:complete